MASASASISPSLTSIEAMFNGHVVLNVAEKPSAAYQLVRLLVEDFRETKGAPPFGRRNSEFEYNGVKMIFTSVDGHVREQCFSRYEKDWKHAPDEFFKTSDGADKVVRKDITQPSKSESKKYTHEELKMRSRTVNALKNLHDLRVKYNFTGLIIWTDDDREGEVIAQDLIDILQIPKCARARFSTLNESSVQKAANNLEQVKTSMVQSSEFYKEGAKRFGATFSRYLTKRCTERFGYSGFVFHIGIVQTAVLGHIYYHEKLMRDQSSQPFYLHCHDIKGSVKLLFRSTKSYDTEDDAKNRVETLEADKKYKAIVKDVKSAIRTYHLCPLNTYSLLLCAYNVLKLPFRETLEIASALTAFGLISYSRTPSEIYTDHDLPSLAKDALEASFPKEKHLILDNREQLLYTPKSGSSNPTHGPIHPRKAFSIMADGWGKKHKDLHELITRYFLGTLSSNLLVKETTITMMILDEEFTAVHSKIIHEGYTHFLPVQPPQYATVKPPDKATEFEPELAVSSAVPPLNITDVLKYIREVGLGSASSAVSTIDNLILHGYVSCENGEIRPTNIGLGLCRGLDDMGWKDLLSPSNDVALRSIADSIEVDGKDKDTCMTQWLMKMHSFFEKSKHKTDTLWLSGGFQTIISSRIKKRGEKRGEKRL